MNKLAFFILATASYAFAAVERYPAEVKPAEFADQEGCYLKSVNKVFPYDTPVNAEDNSCSQYLCSKSNGETQRFTCGAVAIQPGCQAVVDLTQKYPDCCPKIQCDGTTPAPTTEVPSTADTPSATAVPPTTDVPSTTVAVPTTDAPTTTPAVPTTDAPTTTPAVPTTDAPTTTPAVPTTDAPTTTPAVPAPDAPTTTPAVPSTDVSSTTAAPSSAPPGASFASASATSESGKPPVIKTYATPGASASASAT